ncbi:Acylglycerol lipase [Deinococcus proteolyticus MRP]|uniref:Acylglycerol lipase n=1 Tax=Deinococcus proteolyticus (strain ATCC 35074 / DSM 20540 / JCM 6276 / NBRC 101906 / NCIMB 13154 / VKM Ac-1939 / CCM 2703 / MRP) TaxID=693977 RepID=F0RJA2_DEIPM|nr:Acylglycerol lipase [Deinococcus proteolyticus MRP]
MLKHVNVSAHVWATGAPVEGRTWKAANPRAAVLLTHGFGEHLGRYVSHYQGLIPALVNLGFDVYGYDQRGHGQSLGRRAVVNVETLVRDHLMAREQLRRQPLPVYVLGHSLGGLVTALSAARDPRGLSGLVLSSPALLVGEGESALKRHAAPLLARLAPSLPVTALDTAGLSQLPDAISAYQSDPQVYQGKVPALTAASMLQASRQGWKVYPDLKLPTLVVHGSEDQITAPAGSQRFLETIASTDKTLHTVEGGYHELLNDTAGAETVRVILDWLDERAPQQLGGS